MLSFFNFIAKAAGLFAKAIIPPLCPCCGNCAEVKNEFCPTCLAAFGKINGGVCCCCGYPAQLGDDLCHGTFALGNAVGSNLCVECSTDRRNFVAIRSYCQYGHFTATVVRRLKYNDQTDLVKPIAKLLYEVYLANFAGKINFVTGVAMDVRAGIRRMYNQSSLLAGELAGLILRGEQTCNDGVCFLPTLLKKTRATFRQATLDRDRRLTNLIDSMVVCEDSLRPAILKNLLRGGVGLTSAKRADGAQPLKSNTCEDLFNVPFGVLLVDDIVTTGATIEEAARAIKNKFPLARVYAISFSRTLKGWRDDA